MCNVSHCVMYVTCSGVLCTSEMLVLHNSWPVYCRPEWGCYRSRTVTSGRWHSLWCASSYFVAV